VTLTEQQRKVVDAEGNFLLLACPGSGKTRSAAERVARLSVMSDIRIAVCSYTNVGAQRIGAVLANPLGVALDRQHFLGTIHSFLLRYVVYPFAHLLGAQEGPRVREGGDWPTVPVLNDNAKRIGVDKFRMNPAGGLVLGDKPPTIPETNEQVIDSVGQRVKDIKSAIFKMSGALTADDAMWVALKILRTRPVVAAAAAGRFVELLLDEAQDTSELQLACLAELRKSGALRSMVLVGDLEQSIFSFQGASAEGCRRLADDHDLDTIELTENHRSSQRICDVAVHFCSREEPDRAVGPHAECEIEPEVVLYPANEPRATMAIFRARLDQHGIAAGNAAVLARAGRTVQILNGEDVTLTLRDAARLFGRVAVKLADGTLTARHVAAIERTLSYCAYDETNLDALDDAQRLALRRETYGLLGSLPAVEGGLRGWMGDVNARLQAHARALADPPIHTGARTLPAGSTLDGHDANAVFSAEAVPPQAQTVHSLKGEDREAVMIVIRRAHATDPQLALWEAATAGGQIDDDKQEERRVLFVALTRAQRFCLIALPDDARGNAVAEACTDLGFARTGS
jgi:superfamily I DNA/RNA helicase